MEHMDKGLVHCTKMGSDSSDKNTPNAPEFICPICLPKTKSFGFQWKKASLGISSPCNQPTAKGCPAKANAIKNLHTEITFFRDVGTSEVVKKGGQ